MNDFHATLPAELCVEGLLKQTEAYIRREPAKAVAAAFGVGLLVNLVPPRIIVGAVARTGGALLRPTLLALGMFKAFELCCPCKQETVE